MDHSGPHRIRRIEHQPMNRGSRRFMYRPSSVVASLMLREGGQVLKPSENVAAHVPHQAW